MSQVSSTKCEVCAEPLIMFSWHKGDIRITFECGECGKQKSISIDDIVIDEIELECCGEKLYKYHWHDCDVILLVNCNSCINSVAISVDDGMEALGDEEEYSVGNIVH